MEEEKRNEKKGFDICKLNILNAYFIFRSWKMSGNDASLKLHRIEYPMA
jgi:hypothetical protein